VIATTAAMEFVKSGVTGQVVMTWLSEEQFVARSTKAHIHTCSEATSICATLRERPLRSRIRIEIHSRNRMSGPSRPGQTVHIWA
jgi:hypothetical protein